MSSHEASLSLIAERKVRDVDAQIARFFDGVKHGCAGEEHHPFALAPRHLSEPPTFRVSSAIRDCDCMDPYLSVEQKGGFIIVRVRKSERRGLSLVVDGLEVGKGDPLGLLDGEELCHGIAHIQRDDLLQRLHSSSRQLS